MIFRHIHIILSLIIISTGCKGEESDGNQTPNDTEQQFADISEVSATGSAENYTFKVTISSPDTGCDQYADFWEIVSEEGDLIYRRILLHSHVSEQPFTRTGGPVAIAADQVIWIRAHMSNSGYGGITMKGSVSAGFITAESEKDFALDLAQKEPLPDGCDF